MNKDYVFHVNWEDRHKQSYRIGILAQLDEAFYLVIKDERNAKLAYDNGFAGIPGFKAEEVYMSGTKLFDFFERRILEKEATKQCEELARTCGVSMVDSFSVEIISDKLSEKYKRIILEAYELQQRENENKQRDSKQTDPEEK